MPLETPGSSGGPRPAFAGLFWDPDARVYLTKARAYDPVTARFLQPDPQLRVPGASKHSHSLYAYSGGDPVNFVDRNGAESEWTGLTSLWEFAKAFSFNVLQAVDDQIKLISKSYVPPMRKFYSQENLTNMLKYGATFRPSEGSVMDGFYKAFPPLARPQVQDRDFRSKNWLLKTLNSYQEDASWAAYGKPWALLKVEERSKARKLAVDKFAKDHSSYVIRVPEPGRSAENFSRYMGNTQIWTKHGWTSLDWLTTVIDSKNTLPFLPRDPMKRYWLGKTYHNIVNPWFRFKEFPQQGNEYPESDKNAVRIIGEIYDATKSFEHVFGEGRANQDVIPDQSRVWSRPGIGQDARELTHVIMSQIQSMQGIMRKYDTTGGDGLVAGPGGYGSPQAYDALASWRSIRPTSPSPVGGVYLGGAGKSLEGLGQLKGVAVDEASGKLVLIGSDERQISLPPLRLDDIVTIFRAVYDHGQAPSVTIDPDEQNPKGPIMHVKHGPGTKASYVGWVLFECDRIMKTYQMGQDNVTHDTVNSRVPGYANTLEAVFFGEQKQRGPAGPNWERFWIVPAAVRRFDAKTSSLSLFELPLKVNTQKMRWQQGKLVDDNKGESSLGAKVFSGWFSKQYDQIADEVLLTPPPGSGVVAPVAIFHELRRIALIAAIAERLRDQGETMPLWMRDYPVASFPVAETTPSLTIRKNRADGSRIETSSIYGGVNLAPSDRDVHAFSGAKAAKFATVPPEDKVFVELSTDLAASLAPRIPELARAGQGAGVRPAVRLPERGNAEGGRIVATVLPGASTRALLPNRQRVTDIEIPIGFGRTIGLTRNYSSFFDPSGEYGKGWTLDLPELLETKVPVSRDGKTASYRIVYHLISPLGSVDIRFDSRERVEPYGAEMAISKDHPEIAGLAFGLAKIIGADTRQVLFRDGTRWHFDEDGGLLLKQSDGMATRYVRDSHNRILQIVGYVGKKAVAQIQLHYDPRGRIDQAKATQADSLSKRAPSSASEIEFEYGVNGRLVAVMHPKTKEGDARRVERTYAYKANRLSKIGGPGIDLSFGYNERGQLLWVRNGDQKEEYALVSSAKGRMLTVTTPDVDESRETGSRKTGSRETWTYDARMRPVEANLGAGRRVSWQYNYKEISETVTQADQPIFTRSVNQDTNTETIVLTDGPTFELTRDAAGRPTALSRNGVQAWQASWRTDGPLDALRLGNTEVRPRRHPDGWVQGVLVSTPMKAGKTGQWLEQEWDMTGRSQKITDSSGYEYAMTYDDQGRLQTFGRPTEDGKLVGTKLVYDGRGQVSGIYSSSSNEKREYGDSGVLQSRTVERQGAKSVTRFDSHGRPTTRSALDGGLTKWRYGSGEAEAALTEIALPNKERIDVRWGNCSDTCAGRIRLGPAVVRTLSDADGRITEITWDEQVP